MGTGRSRQKAHGCLWTGCTMGLQDTMYLRESEGNEAGTVARQGEI